MKRSIIAAAVGGALLAYGIGASAHQALEGPIDDSALSWGPSKWGKDDRAGSSNHTKNSANIRKALSTAISRRDAARCRADVTRGES